jgi:hypothetical protein
MADWDRLREVGHDVVPPDFDGLARTARHRTRRARAAVGVLTGLVLVGVGVAALDRGRDDAVLPAKDPTHHVTQRPGAARELPPNDAGADSATLAAARYRIPLGGTLAFDVTVPDNSYAHDRGVFVASGNVVLKTEVAGADYGVPADACTRHRIVPAGPSVDDLVQALRTLDPYEVSEPRPVTLGGARGTYLEATLPTSYDVSRCQEGKVRLPGTATSAVDSPAPYVGHWWVLEVAGQRVVIQQACWHCTVAEVEAVAWIADSITFTDGE